MYMYTEENETRRFPMRDFLLKLLLIIIFVLLLVWLLPKAITPKLPASNELSALTSQIFADNLKRMQDAAQSYYTNERLPQEIGGKDTMTLRDMIAKKLLVPFVDKNGKACDVDKSYVTIEKLEDEYLMKVFLSCSDEEDYVLVHMGCYNYCDSDICAKKDEVVVRPSNPVPDNPAPAPTPDPSVPDPVVEYLYEYKRSTAMTLSKWGDWSNWIRYVDADGISAITCADNDYACLRQVKVKMQREKIGTYQKAYVQEHKYQEKIGSYQEYWCQEYAYVKHDNTVYATTGGQWVSQGTGLYTTPPEDTVNSYYVFQGVAWDGCDETCQTLPQFKYEKYTYTGSMVDVTTSPTYTVTCAARGQRTIDVYATRTKAEVAYREEPAYADIKYYSEQFRTILTDGKTDTTWSTSESDQNLINQGFYYTGNKKQK